MSLKISKKIWDAQHNARRLLVERILSLYSKPFFAPLFVFGNQKSGTSAVAMLAGAASGLRVTNDFVGAWEPTAGRLVRSEETLEHFVRKNSWAFSAPIVKEPSLTFVSVPLLDYFGVQKGIFVIREPFANIRSILGRLKISGDIETLDSYKCQRINRPWRAILTGADLNNTSSCPVTSLARRWNRAVEVYLDAPERFVLLRYERFCENKSAAIYNLLSEFDIPVLHSVLALENRQFQPSGAEAGVSLEQFFSQRNHEIIEEICRPVLDRLSMVNTR